MIVCEYENGNGEKSGLCHIPPITPANDGVNYGQACFEGMKAYKDENDEVYFSDLRKILKELINLQTSCNA